MEVGNRDGRQEWDEGDPACAKENISLFSLPGGNLSVAPCRKSCFTLKLSVLLSEGIPVLNGISEQKRKPKRRKSSSFFWSLH